MKQFIISISLLTLSLTAAAQTDSLAAEDTQAQIVEQIEQTPEEITPDSLWDSANTAYINAKYQDAIDLYSAIQDQGLSSTKLYFNLGNAHYKNDDIARAILYYQKALLISPNDEDARYNLGVAQSQIKDQIEEIPEFFLRRWSRSIGRAMGCSGWTTLSLIALALFFASVLAFLLSGAMRLRKAGFGIGLFAAIIFAVSTLYALSERREILEHNQAVVMSKSISIKSSPDRSATDIFILHSGTTVKILREMEGWYEIVITDGKKGWIEIKRVERI